CVGHQIFGSRHWRCWPVLLRQVPEWIVDVRCGLSANRLGYAVPQSIVRVLCGRLIEAAGDHPVLGVVLELKTPDLGLVSSIIRRTLNVQAVGRIVIGRRRWCERTRVWTIIRIDPPIAP